MINDPSQNTVTANALTEVLSGLSIPLRTTACFP
jgi:hypothetical protein